MDGDRRGGGRGVAVARGAATGSSRGRVAGGSVGGLFVRAGGGFAGAEAESGGDRGAAVLR